MRLYVAGPMSGIPHFNIPLFDRVTADLRWSGHEIINPAEEDPQPVRKAALASKHGDPADLLPTGSTHGDLLARDVKMIADGVDGIALLPGWWKSKGARLEAFTALQYSKMLFEADALTPGVTILTAAHDKVRRVLAAWLTNGGTAP